LREKDIVMSNYDQMPNNVRSIIQGLVPKDNIICHTKHVIKRRWFEAEPYIVKNAEWACDYAKYIIKNRWPEAEPNIARKAEWSFFYARDVIKGRWLKAEPIIMKDQTYSHYYNKDILLKY
jgi:hypothetical protein